MTADYYAAEQERRIVADQRARAEARQAAELVNRRARAEARRAAEETAAVARAELVARLAVPTDADRAAVEGALYRPDAVTRIAEMLATQRAELAAAVAPILAEYDEESDKWAQANEDENDSPGVMESANHGETLEGIAHSFADAVRELVEGPATIPPADPVELPDVPLTSGEHLARLIEEEAARRGLTVSDFLNETDTDGTMPRLNAEAQRLATGRA